MLQTRPLALSGRTGIAALFAIVGAFAASCQGNNCSTNTQPQPLTTALATKYRLISVDRQGGLPAAYGDSAGFRLRVWTDSLLLSLNDTTYREGSRVGRLDPSSGDELLHDNPIGPSRKFSRSGQTTVAIPAFLGGAATGTITPSYGFGMLTLTTPAGQTWVFNPIS